SRSWWQVVRRDRLGNEHSPKDGSEFLMAHWSIRDVPHLSGQTALVTGANSGLGFETALALAIAGADVVLACRDETRGSDAVDRIRRTAPAATVELRALDLADQSSIRD